MNEQIFPAGAFSEFDMYQVYTDMYCLQEINILCCTLKSDTDKNFHLPSPTWLLYATKLNSTHAKHTAEYRQDYPAASDLWFFHVPESQ